MAEVAGLEQVWTAQGFHDRFALPFEPGDTGYGHTSAEVAQVRGPPAAGGVPLGGARADDERTSPR